MMVPEFNIIPVNALWKLNAYMVPKCTKCALMDYSQIVIKTFFYV